MSPTSVSSGQRFNAGRRCPICNGWDGGRGDTRCNGFIGNEGQVFCRREKSDIETDILGIRFFVHPRSNGEDHKARLKAAAQGRRDRKRHTPKREPDLIHEYVDLTNTLVLQVLRWYLPGDGDAPPDKRISQRIPDPANPGKWITSGISSALPPALLYHWGEVKDALEASQPVYIAEGETDADAIKQLGECATTNPMGADNFRPAHAQWIASIPSESKLYVCMDRDDAGKKRCAGIRDSLLAAGIADSRISIVVPARGKDVRAHIEAGGNLEGLQPVADKEVEAEETPIAKLRRIAIHSTIDSMLGEDGFAAAPSREYIVEDFLPSGIVGLVVAEGGVGKGHLMVHLGMSLATATPFGPFDVSRECGWVYVSYEDDYDEIHRRIINHRASVSKQMHLDEWERAALLRNVRVIDFSSQMDAVLSKDLVEVISNARDTIPTERCVITIDPLTKILPNDIELNRAEGSGVIMRYLWSLSAAARSATVLAVHHARKPPQMQIDEGRIVTTVHDTMGSAQLVNLSRWVLTVSLVSAEEVGFVGCHEAVRAEVTKSNYTAAIPPMAFVRQRGGALVWREIPKNRVTDAEAAILTYVQSKGLVLAVDLEKQARKGVESGGMGLAKTAFERARKSLAARGLIEQSRSETHRVQWSVSEQGRETLLFWSSGHPQEEEEEEMF